MQTKQATLSQWVAERIDREHPEAWCVSVASAVCDTLDTAGAPSEILLGCPLSGHIAHVRAHPGRDTMAIAAWHACAEIVDAARGVLPEPLLGSASVKPSAVRAALGEVLAHHTQPKRGALLPNVSFCDPCCGYGAMLLLPTLCGGRAIGVETDPAWSSVAKKLFSGYRASVFPHPYQDVWFAPEQARHLHYVVTVLPSEQTAAEAVVAWVSEVGRTMPQGAARRDKGLLDYFAVLVVPEPLSHIGLSSSAERRGSRLTGRGNVLVLNKVG